MNRNENVARRDMNYEALIHQTLGPLIPERSPLALFDFPNHPNVGDSAIWLGEEAYLRRHHPASPLLWTGDYAASMARDLPTLPSGCIVLIHGGGNFGDLWPDHHRLREKLLQTYTGHRIIQLPQSIHFGRSDTAEASRPVFSRHPDFHLLVRDRTSLISAQSLYDCDAQLCPDMALCLGSWRRPVEARRDILALLRTDKEKRVETAPPSASSCLPIEDWLEEEQGFACRADAWLATLERRYPRWISVPQALRQPLYHRLATERVRRGCRQLSSGQVVISDRLHAHILCTLMGIPHVILDNNYRKIGNFRDVWESGKGLCRTAATLEEAIETANAFLQSSRHQSA